MKCIITAGTIICTRAKHTTVLFKCFRNYATRAEATLRGLIIAREMKEKRSFRRKRESAPMNLSKGAATLRSPLWAGKKKGQNKATPQVARYREHCSGLRTVVGGAALACPPELESHISSHGKVYRGHRSYYRLGTGKILENFSEETYSVVFRDLREKNVHQQNAASRNRQYRSSS